jgi:uncharacterized protein (UPF0264 family)
MLAKKTTKNQLTLPKELVKSFPDITYFDIAVKDGKIIMTPVKMKPLDMTLDGIRDKMKRLGITSDDIAASIKWARKK